MIVAFIRRPGNATFKRPPASNWGRGMAAAWAELYSTTPVPADQAAQLERECAAAPYSRRQAELSLEIPGADRR